MKIKKLKTGLTIIHEKDRSTQGVYGDLRFSAGAFNENRGGEFLGIAHFAEHCAAGLASKRFSTKERLKNNGKYKLWNAATSDFDVWFYALGNKTMFETWIDETIEGIIAPNFSDEEFENERKVILSETKYRPQKATDKVGYMWNKYLFVENDINRIDSLCIGDEDSVKKITRQMVDKHMADNFTVDNCIFTVVGNMSFYKVKKLANKYIEKRLPEHKNGETITHLDIREMQDIEMVVENSPQEESAIIMYFKLPGKKQNYYKNVKYQLLRNILNEKIYQYIRNEKGLCYSISAAIYVTKEEKEMLEINTSFKQENLNEIILGICEFFSNSNLCQINDEEFNRIRKNYINNLDLDSTNLSAAAHSLLNQYYKYEKLISKKERDNAVSQLKDLEVEEYNQLLTSFVQTPPQILIATNFEKDKIISYEEIKSYFKKNEEEA